MFLRSLIILSLLSLNLYSQPGEYKFEHLSIADGLSHNSVTSIIQDHKGFLWIGTIDGLNLYNGYNFRVFKADPFDSGSVSSNKITKLYEDSRDRLWIGTRNGLNYFDWNSFSFREISFDKYRVEGEPVFVKAIYEDSDNNLWIGTYGMGLYLYDTENENLSQIPLEYSGGNIDEDLESMVSGIYEDSRGDLWIGTSRTGIFKMNRKNFAYEFLNLDTENRLPENSMVKTIYEDREGFLWVCSERLGVFRIRPGDLKVQHFEYSSGKNSLSNNIVKDIFQDDQGYIWLATDGGGINILDPSTGDFRHLKYDVSDASSLSGNAIYTFYKDNRDILWIGTFGGGINILDPNKKPFYHFTQEESQPNSLSHPSVLSFEEDSEGLIWIGTDGGGLNLYDPETGEFKSYQYDPLNDYSLSSNAVTSVYEDSFGNLWVGTFSGGLNLLDRSSERFYNYQRDENEPLALSNDNVWVIYETRTKQLLIGTLGGLNLLDRKSMKFIPLEPERHAASLRLERILALNEDSEGNIWIGSNQLWKLSLRDTSFEKVPLVINHDTLQWEYDVREIMEDSRGIVWIGTEGGGLLKYNDERESFTSYTVNDGLSNNAVHEIIEDDYGFLWISTNGGLSKFDIEEGEFRNYDKSDGLQSSQFSYSAGLKTSDGLLYFGGVNGFNRFDPAQIKDNKDIPPVIITDFRLFNRPVHIGEKDSPLTDHISETEDLTLKHNQSVITFEFASLNYTSSQKNQYQYIMDGFEEEWNEVGSQRTATYTNLDPGEYIFRVRGSNNDGIWNKDGTSMKITILPPFWETKFAFFLYGMFIILLLFSFRRFAISRAQMKNELRLKDLEKQKIEEVNQMKMQFFTNISHEFRTPLTLILSPLEKLLHSDKADPVNNQLYRMMHRNAIRLLSLINQLMDLRKIEKGLMDLRLTRKDIVSFVNDIKTAFDELATEKRINFVFSSNIPNMEIWFDSDKTEKIVYNLLSNAFKFTSEGGKISVKVKLKTAEQIKSRQTRKFRKREAIIQPSLEAGYIEISVKDNGAGIAREDQDKIFQRFYQVHDSNSKKRNSGTGIGLSLSRDLAKLHNGDLTLVSSPGKGSKFSLMLPIDHNYYSDEQFIKDNLLSVDQNELEIIPEEAYVHENESEKLLEDKSNEEHVSSVLIVEDNPDVRNFIRLNLEGDYNICEAEDGRQGIEMARKQVPDIILSDIMMPETDGIEMAKILCRDDICSHIPIIFLTAKTAEQNKLKGLETGVIDYINKPFNPQILALKIRNIIEKQQKNAERIRKSMLLEPHEVQVESMDEKFLKKAMEIVEDHISDSEFDVQQFVAEMGMSRSVLYRKLRAVTNQSANEFINLIRLKRAAQLLSKNTMNVSEISYMVGFNDPQYFSKCFRKQYGKTPSQYASNPV